MNDKDQTKKRIPWYMIVVLLVLLVFAARFSKKLYISYKHPYKDNGVVGTWNYDYSVTFDEEEQWKRADEDRYNPDLYIDAEIAFNDDGRFNLAMDEIKFSGSWKPDDNVSNLFILTPESSNYNDVIDYNEVRWDKKEDKLFFSLSKETVPKEFEDLFKGDEVYRDVFLKIDRPKEKIVYIDSDGDNDERYEDDWDDDNGLPFNYHP